jgi:two-component system cell cycle sensor histidine kinase/response regulator CckA
MTFGEPSHHRPEPEEHGSPKDSADGEKRYRLILDSGPDGIATLDESGRIVDWNSRAEALFGWTAGEAAGHPMAGLIISPQFREMYRQRMRFFLDMGEDAGSNRRLELHGLRKDGGEFPIELTIARAKIAGSWIFTCFMRDITARKAAEDRALLQLSATRVLSESRSLEQTAPALIDAILEHSPWDVGALWTLDRESGALRCAEIRQLLPEALRTFSEGSRQMILRPGEGLPGKIWKEKKPAWIRNVVLDPVFRRSGAGHAAGLRTAFAFPIFLFDSILGVCEFFSASDLEEDAELAELLVSIGRQAGQFLERRQAEEDLRESHRRLDLVVNNVNDIVALFAVENDGTLRCVEINEVYLSAAGKNREEVVGRAASEIIPPAGFSAWSEMIRAFVRARAPGRFEWTSTTLTDPKMLEIRVTPICDGAGPCTHVLLVCRDITEFRRREEELRQSQKMDAVGRMAGGIAHDFNNLLTAINGYSSLALSLAEPNSQLGNFLAEIARSGERASALTRQLLAFSRKQMLTPKVLNLNEIVENMDSLLRRVLGENILIDTVTARDLKPIKVDPGQVEQVLLNLVINARDAMPAEGGRLSLETANVDLEAGPHVMLAVGDNGCGMTPQVQARVFEPFFTTKEAGKGTGMGLATVFGIVKQSGGDIVVHSEPRKGSIFRIYFPAVDGEEAEPKRNGGKARNLPKPSETVLLVEDDQAVRQFIHDALEALGYTVMEARNGEEALQLARGGGREIHMLLSDVVMPGINGRRLFEELRAAHPAARVLFMSGYTDAAVMNNGMLEGTFPFLQKPFTVEKLAESLWEALHGEAAARE